MTVEPRDLEIEQLRKQLAESDHARTELAEALGRMLKPFSEVEIAQHGGYRHAARLVAENLHR